MTRNKKAKNLSVIVFGILVSMLLSCTLVFAQTRNETNKLSDREKDGLLGPVKSMAFFFDGSSTPIWTKCYREDGSRETAEYMIGTNPIIQTFDNKGRIIKSELSIQGKKELTSYSIYDDTNHTCTTYFQDPKHLPKEIIQKLTDDGNALETTHYSPNGDYIGNTLYQYTETGLLVLMIKNNKHGMPFETYKTLYDLYGRILEINRFDNKNYKDPKQSILAHKECYTYDSEGRLTEKRIYMGSDQRLSTIITYMDFDQYGNSTKQIHEDADRFLNKFFPPIKFVKYEYFE
ncbi:MAG: hypothetical protein H6Q72_2957 [Firmicutes bacterium]|nr:hypothetical protein [Bacillota bacterium]